MSNLYELTGPLFAEGLRGSDEIIESYISCNNNEDISKDKYIAPIISGNKLIISGVRGSGKTMILKTAEAVMKKDLYHKTFEVNEWELSKDDVKMLPVYISYSGFKDEVSLGNLMELNEEEIKRVKQIFRAYFFMQLLQQILRVIEISKLDENIDFNFFGLRTKFGIKRQVDNVINRFRRLGFREIVKSKKDGIDLGLKIKVMDTLDIGPKLSGIREEKETEIRLDDMQKTSLFKDTIDSLCKTYNIDKIVFLFDEVYYLKYLQSEFFDVLFGFRNFDKISFSISAYPTFMEYGEYFDIPDDAKELSVSSVMYKPSKTEFENPLIKLVELRLKKYGGYDYRDSATCC